MTILSAGDIAFTAFQSDNAGGFGGDAFQFVLLKSVDAGTTIHFTDNGYLTTTGAYRTNEQLVRWVAQSDLPAGTVITFLAPGGIGAANTAEWTGINPATGAVASGASLDLRTNGDSIIALQNVTFGGADNLNGTALTALYFGASSFPATFSGGSTAHTALPPGLTDGVNAISMGPTDNGRYDETIGNSRESGSVLVVGLSINNEIYWIISNATLTPHATTATFVLPTPGNDTMTGDTADDLIDLLAGNDTYDGGAGSDVIEGGLGSDTLTGGIGADDLVFDAFDASATQLDTVTDFSVAEDQVVFKSNGPSSEHVLRTYMLDALKTGAAQFYTWWNGREQSLTLTGLTAASLTSANFVFDTSAVARVVTGTALGDVLFGGLGNDTLSGSAGDDLLLGDAGDDTLTGGTGSNRYEGGAGADTFDGSASGSDRVDYTTPGGITLILNGSGVGDAGSLGEALGDTFIGIESIRATKDNDVITVDTFVDTVIGFDGDDIITGSSDKNDLQGGNGTDTIVSGGGNDYLSGGAGNDTITITGTYTLAQAVGGTGDDIITGGDFSDIVYGGADNDTIDGGNGADYIYGEAGVDIAHGGGGNDIFTDADGMSGDQYFGEAGYDRIIYTVGGTFNFTAGGADILDATIENVIFQAAVTVTGTSLANTYTGSASGDTISGGDGHDWINGGAGNDTLTGDAGDDRLHGDAGTDTLRGGQGSDTLSGGVPGGAGDGVRDNFLYFAADINTIDRIQGFEAGIDKITLDAASFGLAAGTLEASRFYAWGDSITTSGSAFIYRATDGALFWDANGSSAGGLNAMAYLNNIPALAASDIVVV